ncbi:VOC family protein [Streptomyces sp. NPDC001822]|uniref:VOC family protein n=1 Tax=Streptomyces sp. NPDC001822 TaxID=3364614 RepID=UPI00368C281C
MITLSTGLSVTEENFAAIVGRLREHDIEFMEIKGSRVLNLFVADPNGLRIELATEKLGYSEGEYLL